MSTDAPKSAEYPIRRLMGVQIAAVGANVPDRVVTNAELQQICGVDPEWIIQRTGIRERRHARDVVGRTPIHGRARDVAVERTRRRKDRTPVLMWRGRAARARA